MSCIVGIINLDGEPVDRALLEHMTRAMEGRAPDESRVWCSGNAGFGHAMLRVAPESQNEHQPCSLDGEIWITADARIDGRADLIAKLRAAGAPVGDHAPGVELILHAYRALGESFPDHLIGDFAFALWDARRQKLICARDHFGVKPFCYARTGRTFLFASDIRALLRHPATSTRLDEISIGDFLMMGCYLDAGQTIYESIRCLPPAHAMHIDRGGIRTVAYWKPSPQSEVRYRRESEYAEQFRELFRLAVEDRLRTETIAVEMSGGMDSSAIAAVAVEKLRPAGGAVTAFTGTCAPLLPEDREAHYAGLVASHLGIPVVYTNMGDFALFDRPDRPELRTAEPVPSPDVEAMYQTAIRIGKCGARVTLNGFAGDAVLAGSSSYFAGLLRRGRLDRLLIDIYQHWRNTGTVRGLGLRSMLRGRSTMPADTEPEFRLADWLDAGFVKRHALEERWRTAWDIYRSTDPLDQLLRPWTSQAFTGYGQIQMPLEARYPFLDVRLVSFLIALPNPLKFDKHVLRQSMRGHLPEAVRTRPKQGLAGDPVRARIVRDTWRVPMESPLAFVGNGYVDRSKYQSAFKRYHEGEGKRSTFPSEFIILPVALDNWMQYR